MKPLKVVVLVAFAAAALIALVGAGTASATVLCKNNLSTTACSETYAAGTELKLSLVSGTKSKLVTAFKTIECSKSTALGKVENAGGSSSTVSGKFSTLTFEECNCELKVLKNGSFEVHSISGTDNGTFTVTATETTASCSTIFGTVHCIYVTENTDLGTLAGGNPAKLEVKEVNLPRLSTNSLCAEKAAWTASYEATNPKPLYVAGAGGGPTETTLTTSLSGEGKSGAEITVNEGSKVKDTATLSGTNASKATGTVKYKVYSDKECKELVTSAGEVTVSGGSVPASEEQTLEAGRAYYWQAEYSGDSNNLKSTSACGSEIAYVKAGTSLTTTLSGGGQEGGEVQVEEASAVKDKATLSGTNASKATGTVKYKVYSDKECKELVTSAGEVTVSGGSVPSSSEVKLSDGFYYWQASYEGDATHSSSTSACGSEIEVVTEKTSLSTTLGSETESGTTVEVKEGEWVRDAASLSGTQAAKATGYVRFSVYADSECKELVADAGTVVLLEETTPESNPVELAGGTYYWQAEYFGDSLNQASTSTCGAEIEKVIAAPLTTSLSGEAKTGAEIEVEEKTPVTDTATLHEESASTATGTVKYKVYSDSECKELVAEAGEVTVTEGKIPASKEEALSAGIYYWQAVYSGDLSHAAATSACGSEVEVVAAATSLTTSLSGGGKSGTEIEVREGEAVADQASISGTNASGAGGAVVYSVYSDSECKELVAEAGSVEASAGTVPKSKEVQLPVGTYYWRAEYFGDSLNQGSISSCGSEIETVAVAALTNELNGGGHSGAEIEVEEETPVTDTATLHEESASTATGTVKYKVYSDPECKELVAEAGEVTVTEGKIPASSKETLAQGTYYWQSTYSGDKSHAAATSVCVQAVQKVNEPWIVSVGDSYISGEGGRWAGNTGSNADWKKIDALGKGAYKNPLNGEGGGEAIEGCHRSISAEIFIQIPKVKSKNLACSGAETVSKSSGTIVAFGKVVKTGTFTPGLDFANVKKTEVINPGKGRCGLATCKGQALLLQEFAEARKAAKESIKMVVVSIGGNDFGFGELLASCVKRYLAFKECNGQPAQKNAFEKASLEAKQKLIETGIKNVGEAMKKAGYAKGEYTILVQDYPSPLPEENRYAARKERIETGGCAVADEDMKWANATALKGVNETVLNAFNGVNGAKEFNLAFMELKEAFNGRRLCEKGLRLVAEGKKPKFPTWRAAGAVDETEWINQLRLVTLGTEFFQQEDLHPNYWGQLALRNCVRQAYNNGAPKGGTCGIEAKGLFAPPGAPAGWKDEPKMKLGP